MPVMEGAHGRDQRDPGLAGAKAVERATQGGDGTDDHGIA